ncbi:uncharacterized protein V1510DRAFT_358995 [Dipodascopsis tothii]|uniref:uncharacterized protein n=1 Tax=Dipodascopsis tothii TaxID=44089 RepID=UPI0034CE4ACF
MQPTQRTQRKLNPVKLKAAAVSIHLPKFITIVNLSKLLGVRVEHLTRKMRELGFEHLGNDHVLDFETSGLIATEYNFEPIEDEDEAKDLLPAAVEADMSGFPERPPIVTIMGHVDHGKTTILDYLRKSSIVAGEHGGITQHIGAFSVGLASGKTITFLDTPGHSAFLKMRQRGANITDIVVLVVAADDSIMPQTKEAIKHAKAAGVPMIVAINKVDKPNVDIPRVLSDLAANDIDIEDYGGETQVVRVSGLTGQGIDTLEDAIVTLSEIQDYRAPQQCAAEGWVLESVMKKGRGNVATVLVRRGVLKAGCELVAGTCRARVRSLRDENGKPLKTAGPGHAVEVDGWKTLPEAGDEVLEAKSERAAKDVVEYRESRLRHLREMKDIDVINEKRRAERRQQAEAAEAGAGARAARPEPAADDGPTRLNFIVRSDVSGSAEAIVDAIEALGNDEVHVGVLSAGVGSPTESDVELAHAAGAAVLCFHVKPDKDVVAKAARLKIDLARHTVIYHLIEDVTARLSAELAPIIKTEVVGEAEIRGVFTIMDRGKPKKIAGCRVLNGSIAKSARVRVQTAAGATVFEGAVDTLRHLKAEIAEAKKGSECGLSLKDWEAFDEGMTVQAITETAVKRYL